MPKWKKPVRITLVLVILGGAGLLIEHLAFYGMVWHWAWVDHGAWGAGLMIIGLVAAALIFRPKKGG